MLKGRVQYEGRALFKLLCMPETNRLKMVSGEAKP